MKFSSFALSLLPVLASSNVFDQSTSVFVQTGTIRTTSAIIMARCNFEEESDVVIKIASVSGRKSMEKTITDAPKATSETDYTSSFEVDDLTPNTKYEYRVECNTDTTMTSSNRASFWTAPDSDDASAIQFVWAADLAGQGWGRNPELKIVNEFNGLPVKGGYVVFETMRQLKPNFALFQGDMIYADNAIPATKEIPKVVGGGTWINKPTKDFAAITLDEFRANWKYNFGDDKMKRFLEEVPIYVQWDDHEVTNNWYPGEVFEGSKLYPDGTLADDLAKNARQAMFEFNPIIGPEIYTTQQHGKHLEIFLVDYRTYRGQNPDNSDEEGIPMMGEKQLDWLLEALKASNATWKVISTHDPVGIVTGGEGDRDSFGQNEDEVLGRELELQKVLETLYENEIKNVVWLTSDVHFCAAVSYEPSRATFQQFYPFMEFVIGAISSGAFGPAKLDGSFGPKYEFVRAPGELGGNLPPPHFASFGGVKITEEGDLTATIYDITGKVLYEKTLVPQ